MCSGNILTVIEILKYHYSNPVTLRMIDFVIFNVTPSIPKIPPYGTSVLHYDCLHVYFSPNFAVFERKFMHMGSFSRPVLFKIPPKSYDFFINGEIKTL